MADPFVAEIRIVGFNFAPKGWAFCDGQILPLSQNVALFSLLGTTYGGDGQSTFALPDLRARVPMHPGQGPGLSLHDLGESAGTETVTLLESEIPGHSHQLRAVDEEGDYGGPNSNAMLARSSRAQIYTPGALNAVLDESFVAPTGGDQPHNNMQPSLVLNFVIALQGVFPPRE